MERFTLNLMVNKPLLTRLFTKGEMEKNVVAVITPVYPVSSGMGNLCYEWLDELENIRSRHTVGGEFLCDLLESKQMQSSKGVNISIGNTRFHSSILVRHLQNSVGSCVRVLNKIIQKEAKC